MPPANARQEKLAKMRLDALRGAPAAPRQAGAAAPHQADADEASRRPSGGSASARGPPRGNGDRGQQLLPLSARGAAADAACAGGSTTMLGAPLRPSWSMVDRMAATMQELDSERQRVQRKELQARFRGDLERQVGDTKLKRERERELDSKHHEDLVASYSTWKQTEEAKESKVRLKAVKGLQGLQESAKQNQEHRDGEMRREKDEALAIAQRNKREVDEEKIRLATATAVKRAEYKSVLQANQLERENAKKTKVEEREMANQAIYQRQREARDKQVEDAKAAKVERRLCISENMGTYQAESEQKLRQEAVRKALDERNAMDKLSLDKETEKVLKQKRDLADIQRHQIDQIHEKREARKAELEQKRGIAQQLESDVLAFEREQQSKSDAARQRNSEYRKELEKQTQAKNAAQVIRRDGMSDTELRLNRRLLENAAQILSSPRGGGLGQSAR